MVRSLNKAAKDELLNSPDLYAAVCKKAGVKVVSLSQLIYRNSPVLTNHDVVMLIASAMNKNPDEILEVSEEVPAN